jgi:hypothetical protein
MKSLAATLAALALLSATPLAAQTLTVLLPSISFPDGTLTPSTKGCAVLLGSTNACPQTK